MTAVVALGRIGDIIQCLPCVLHIAEEEGQCAVVVTPEFAPVLEGCSYATPILFHGSIMDTEGAIAQVRKDFERVLVSRVCERAKHKCESFNEESWHQLGCLHLWNQLPLVFDKRSAQREQALIKQHISGRSFALYNMTGKSSPVPNGEQWIERNNGRIAPGLPWVNLGAIKAYRIYDLLGLMDWARILVTGDTSTLHLAAASRVPAVNLLQCKPSRWHGSKPRNNSVARWYYDQMPQLYPIPT